MKQLFNRHANFLAKFSIVFSLVVVLLVLGFFDHLQKSPIVTEVNTVKSQPVPFSHKHHVQGMGIDCRYCHTSVEKSSYAQIPGADTCMNCHSVLFADVKALEPIREAYRTGKPLKWNRVYDLPDFVYFNHSIHINKGIGCTTCHGPIHEMPLTSKYKPFYMKDCLECHKNPTPYLRSAEDVFNVNWTSRDADPELQKELKSFHQIGEHLINCSICHR